MNRFIRGLVKGNSKMGRLDWGQIIEGLKNEAKSPKMYSVYLGFSSRNIYLMVHWKAQDKHEASSRLFNFTWTFEELSEEI